MVCAADGRLAARCLHPLQIRPVNAQVFKTIDEVLAFLELSDAWTAGDRAASGLVWVRLGPDAPTAWVYGKEPRELCHQMLSKALAKQLERANGKEVETTRSAEGKVDKAESAEGKAKALELTSEQAAGQTSKMDGEASEAEGKQAKEEATATDALDPARLELSEEEWKKLGVSHLSIERFVRIEVDGGTFYYAPEDADDKHEARPKTYSRSFAAAGCTSALLCKKLDDRQLKDDLKVERLGDRMRLLEQFRFL